MERFERAFAEKIGVRHAATVCNGTAALHLALLALGIGAGDEVLVPTLTYVASVNAITYTGATPVFCDSLPTTWQIGPEDIRKKITKKTKAIMVVHLYGHPCDMSAITQIATENNLLIVEDCAEAFGSCYKGRFVGGIGSIATFSFFGNKTITTGEGGMVVTNSQVLFDKVNHLKGQGLAKNREYWHDVVGYNYRMTNICAALGLAQLECADSFLLRKRQIAEYYRDKLSHLPLEVHREFADTVHSYWMVSIVVGSSELRDKLRKHLLSDGIESRPFFAPVHTMPMYSEKEYSLPTAEDLAGRGLNLPSWPGLVDAQLQKIVSCIDLFYAHKARQS